MTDPRTRVAVVVGNPKPGSRTLAAGDGTSPASSRASPTSSSTWPTSAPRCSTGTTPASPTWSRAVGEADLVVVASPTYKGTYTGLLKLFLDRFSDDRAERRGRAADARAPGRRTRWRPELTLRPVLTEIGGTVPVRGLYVHDTVLRRPGGVRRLARDRSPPGPGAAADP